jgi:hypothetical protein
LANLKRSRKIFGFEIWLGKNQQVIGDRPKSCRKRGDRADDRYRDSILAHGIQPVPEDRVPGAEAYTGYTGEVCIFESVDERMIRTVAAGPPVKLRPLPDF